MKLEKIVLNGFKSFADKTEFLFNCPITAIVGPNGCGKSNVVDALKWVLGEQSTKSLRSGNMADVIFSGSSSRKPQGMAEVSLYFSETASLGIDQDELQITRRLYRSGESEYLINSKPSRLKDIRELFMDTGVGVRAYSIIEQGQISQLLTSSKADRRVIFEEAAGISKYKAQKKEALRKLERTEQNLLRLADIVGEVQRQLRSIKLQAGKARNYLQYSQRLKELRVNYSLSQYHEISTETGTKNAELAEFQSQFASIVAEVGSNDSKLSRLGNEIIEKENEINACDNALVTVKSKIEQHQQRIEFLHSRINELTERKESESEQIKEIHQRSGQFDSQLQQEQKNLEEIEKLTEERTILHGSFQDELHEINMVCAATETELEDEKSGIIDIVRRTAQLHNEIQNISVYRNNLNGQKDRLSGRVDETKGQLEGLLGQKAQNHARLDDINKVIAQLQESLQSRREQIQKIDAAVAETGDRLSGAREARSAIRSEIKVLTDMENRREGLKGAVKDILAQSEQDEKSCIDGIVADVIKAQAEYAVAVEAALEGKTDAIIVNDHQVFLNDKQIRDKVSGRVKFICADRAEPFVETLDLSKYPNIRGRVVEFIEYPSRYAAMMWDLLGRVVLVDSLDDAIELSVKLGRRYSFVTVDGQALNSGGLICAGPVGEATGLISRKSRLGQIEKELEVVSAQIIELEGKLSRDVQENEHLEKLCKDFRTSVYEATTEKTYVASELSIIEQNIKRLTDEQPVLVGEIEMLESQISQTVQTEYDSKQSLEELETVNAQRNSRIEELEARLTDNKELAQQKNDELTKLKIILGQTTEQRKATKQTIISLQSQIQHNKTALDSANNNMLACEEQLRQAQRSILDTEAEISELFADKDKAQIASNVLHEEVRQMLAEQKQTEMQLREKRSQQSKVEENLHQVKLVLSQLEVKSTDLVQRVAEELQMDLSAEYANYSEEDVDWNSVKEEITQLRGRIERLGNVNVDAISEQEELEKRNEFLTNQIDDLDKSRGQLQQLINRLNKECIEKFATTFEEVRVNFQELFRKLFGGGKADVVLEEPEDILESGIEIVARPPGKEPRSISLLSGGEKSMTAIALLFAIFKTKPSPFCFLDEVDAALDEANNERFNMIVQEFQKYSQFVVITHAKRTMSIADVLVGVTMQQKGVSKKISVTFDNVETESEEVTAVA